MIETHPFGNFVPRNARYLILGSFTGRQAVLGSEKHLYNWFYTNKRNQFWPLLRQVYHLPLKTKSDKQKLFRSLGLAITDIILQCERKANSNLDVNLTNIVYNTSAITSILRKRHIKTIFFSSRFVEQLFKRNFQTLIRQNPKVHLVTLPSPSPRFAAMTISQKVTLYNKLLPKLNTKSSFSKA